MIMRKFYPIILCLFFMYEANRLYAQETIDEFNFQFRMRPEDFIIDRNWKLDYPTLTEISLFEGDIKKYLFQGNWNKKVEPFYQSIALVDRHSLHLYASKSMNTFVLSKPLSFGFDYHLKPIMGWERLDVFFFGQGFLFNQDLLAAYKLNIAPMDGRTLYMEVGAGIEYDLGKNWSAFYEFSPSFMNKTYLGSRHKAGVRYRF